MGPSWVLYRGGTDPAAARWPRQRADRVVLGTLIGSDIASNAAMATKSAE